MSIRGHVTTEFTFWCGQDDCQNWEQFAHHRLLSHAAREAQRKGWRKHKGLWRCPEHSGASPAERPADQATISVMDMLTATRQE